jgi:tetratricopeptide (TPR) repeat protein
MQKYAEAATVFDRSVEITQASTLPQEMKDNTKLQHHFNLAALAIDKKDYAGAKKHAEEFQQGAASSNNPAREKQVHELAGRVALAEKDFNKAIAELEQANQQNPVNLYRLSLAYQGKGDRTKAQEFAKRAAEFNSLPQLNYALIRSKAQKLGSATKA